MGWSSQITIAQIVIVEGNGEVGLFLYKVGTAPGPGNPPILAISSSSEDPFGNSILPADASTAGSLIALGTAGSFMQIVTTAGLASLLLGTGSGGEIEPGFLTSDIVLNVANVLQTVLGSPQTSAAGPADARLILGSETLDGITQGGYAQLVADSSGASLYVGSQNLAKANPTILVNGGIYPVNGAAPARISRTPLALINGFGTVAGELVPSVFLDPLNGGVLTFAGRMTVPAAPNAIDFAVLPAGLFSPNTPFVLPANSRRAPISYLGGTALAGSPRIFMTSTGHLQLSSIPAGGAGNDVDLGGAVIRLA